MLEQRQLAVVRWNRDRKQNDDEEGNEGKGISTALVPFNSQAIFKKFLAAGVVSLPLRSYEQPGADEDIARNRISTQVSRVIADRELRRLDLLRAVLLLFPCPPALTHGRRSPFGPRETRVETCSNAANYHLYVAAQPLPQQAILLRGVAAVLLQQWLLLAADIGLLARRLLRIQRQAVAKSRFPRDPFTKEKGDFFPRPKGLAALWGELDEAEDDGDDERRRMGVSKVRRKRARTRGEGADEQDLLLRLLQRSEGDVGEARGGRRASGLLEHGTKKPKNGGPWDSLGDSLAMTTESQEGLYAYPTYEFDYDAIMQRLSERPREEEAGEEGCAFLENELRKLEAEREKIARAQAPPPFFPEEERNALHTSFADDRTFLDACWAGYKALPPSAVVPAGRMGDAGDAHRHSYQDSRLPAGAETATRHSAETGPLDRRQGGAAGGEALTAYEFEKLRADSRLAPVSLTMPFSSVRRGGRMDTTTSHLGEEDASPRDATRDRGFFEVSREGDEQAREAGSGVYARQRFEDEDGACVCAERREGDRQRAETAVWRSAYAEDRLNRWGDEHRVRDDTDALDVEGHGGISLAESGDWFQENFEDLQRGPTPASTVGLHGPQAPRLAGARATSYSAFGEAGGTACAGDNAQEKKAAIRLRSTEDVAFRRACEELPDGPKKESGKVARRVSWDSAAFSMLPELLARFEPHKCPHFLEKVRVLQQSISRAQRLALTAVGTTLTSPLPGLFHYDPCLALLCWPSLDSLEAQKRRFLAIRKRGRLPKVRGGASGVSCDLTGPPAYLPAAGVSLSCPLSLNSDFSMHAQDASSVSAWRCLWADAVRRGGPGAGSNSTRHAGVSNRRPGLSAEAGSSSSREAGERSRAEEDGGGIGESVGDYEAILFEEDPDAGGPQPAEIRVSRGEDGDAWPAGRRPRASDVSREEPAGDSFPVASLDEPQERSQTYLSSDAMNSSDYVEVLRGLFDSSSLTQGLYTPCDLNARLKGSRHSSHLLHQYLCADAGGVQHGRGSAHALPGVGSSFASSSSSRVQSGSERASEDFFDGDLHAESSEDGSLAATEASRAACPSAASRRASDRSWAGGDEQGGLSESAALAHPHAGGKAYSSDSGVGDVSGALDAKTHTGLTSTVTSRDSSTNTSHTLTTSSVSSDMPRFPYQTLSSGGRMDDASSVWADTGQARGGTQDTATREGFRSFLYALLRRQVLLADTLKGERLGGAASLAPVPVSGLQERDSSRDVRGAGRVSGHSEGLDWPAAGEYGTPAVVARLPFHEIVPRGRLKASTAAKAFQHLLALHSRGEILLTQETQTPARPQGAASHAETAPGPCPTLFVCGTRDILFADARNPQEFPRPAEREQTQQTRGSRGKDAAADACEQRSLGTKGGERLVVCA
ncbi:hypothetical protein BESB_016270 [Besnoitia besnoiti]|uniref:Uncharacterized protein n=1 Tax=Besnoitia besnoiti TaxID=94643 RepID=A0A2A9M2Z2_BESBE|nr:hypothetical protein BESB_016270 [Besnoitia besnoiti]PFH32309.1 hypothetical protein BESB_016270 [Besnoitia besnoiti]